MNQNLRCSIHINQPLTNFCTRQECLIELCASCIGHHTDQHALAGTLPHYQNIQLTYKKAHQAVDLCRAGIESQKKRIIEYNQLWEKKKQNIFQVIRVARKEAIQLVEKTFVEMEKNYTQRVLEEQIRIGMRSGDKVMKMLEAHSLQSTKLFDLQTELITPMAPQAVKALYGQVLNKNAQTTGRIAADLNILQSFDLRLDFIQSNLLPLKQSVIDLFNLQVSYPQQIVQRQPLIQVVETVTPSLGDTFAKTTSSFYSRPISLGKNKPSVTYMNSRSQIVVQSPPKVSVLSLTQTLGGSSGSSGFGNPLRLSKRSTIFPARPASSYIR